MYYYTEGYQLFLLLWEYSGILTAEHSPPKDNQSNKYANPVVQTNINQIAIQNRNVTPVVHVYVNQIPNPNTTRNVIQIQNQNKYAKTVPN